MTVTIENLYTGNGSTTDYSFTFPYLDTTDIKATLGTVPTTAYSLLNATTVRFTSAPSNGVAIRIYRDTAFETPKATFYPGSAIRANDLNDNTLQNLYVNQESNDKVADAWLSGDPTITSSESWWTSDDTKVGTTKAIENRIAAQIDTAIEGDVLAGTDLTKSQTGGQVTINHSVTGASSVDNSNGVVIQDLTINGRGHVTGTGSYNLDGRYYTESELNAGQLDNRYYTETELNAGQLDNRYYTETEADARFYRLASAEEIQSGETWVAADNKVATTSAIDARITDLVDDVGGFVPIANETSFPNANPDVNNGAGTLVSIKALSSNLTSNGSGVATIANGTVGNSTVTINGLENSTTYGSTLGMIVETTSTLNTYTFHRVTPKATEVTTVASNISNVNAVAGNSSNINAAVSNATNINAAVSNASNINSAVSNASNITSAADNETNINAAVSNASNINAAVSNASNINSAVSNASNINSAVSNASNINAVVGNATNINTVAGANSNITSVAGSIANVNTTASNISNVNNFAELYQISTSTPSTDGGGNSLAVGDLWFDSSSNKQLKVHTGSAFQAVSPTQSVLNDISIVSGQLTYTEDLGAITDSLDTGTGNNINTVASNISSVNTVASNNSNINTVAGINSNVNIVAGGITNINTTANNLASINNFAEVYRIASSAPSSSLNEGDLWYDSAANVLKYYNGTTWTVTAAAGLSNIVEDSTPELGGHLDCNNKNLTEVGTVSGDNLQIDFGTL